MLPVTAMPHGIVTLRVIVTIVSARFSIETLGTGRLESGTTATAAVPQPPPLRLSVIGSAWSATVNGTVPVNAVALETKNTIEVVIETETVTEIK